MSPLDDAEDVRRVLAGDLSAFEGIVRRWQLPLVNLAYRFCRDRARAEEMAQEAFLRAYRGLAQWRGDAAFSTWLIALAANQYRSAIQRRPIALVALDQAAELMSQDPNISVLLLDRDRDEAIRAAVLALPAKYRDALTLYYFHELDLSTAAQSLAVPEGTLKARLMRGRELLRAKFARGVVGMRLKEAQ